MICARKIAASPTSFDLQDAAMARAAVVATPSAAIEFADVRAARAIFDKLAASFAASLSDRLICKGVMFKVSVICGVLAIISGCSTVKHVQVKVPVPVACQEQVPERPEMPSESLQPGVAPWVLLRAALAEIDRREGFEVQLVAALVACTAPVAVTK